MKFVKLFTRVKVSHRHVFLWHQIKGYALQCYVLLLLLPVFSLHLVICDKAVYVLHYFFTPGQQEHSCCLLLQPQTWDQLRIRLHLHPIHHFGENRQHRGDGCSPAIIWEQQQSIHMYSGPGSPMSVGFYIYENIVMIKTIQILLYYTVSSYHYGEYQQTHNYVMGVYWLIIFLHIVHRV